MSYRTCMATKRQSMYKGIDKKANNHRIKRDEHRFFIIFPNQVSGNFPQSYDKCVRVNSERNEDTHCNI